MGYEEQIDIIANMNAWQRNKLLKMVADMAAERKADLEKKLTEIDDKIKLTANEIEAVSSRLFRSREELTRIKLERNEADKLFLKAENRADNIFRENHDELIELIRTREIRMSEQMHKFKLCEQTYPEPIENENEDIESKINRSTAIENHALLMHNIIQEGKSIMAAFNLQYRKLTDADAYEESLHLCENVYKKYMNTRHMVMRLEEELEVLTDQLSDLKSQHKLATTELEEINA